MLLSPEISTLENCKRSKSVWRFYQSKRIILRIRQWFSSMMFYDSGDVVPFTPTQGIWCIWPSTMKLWCSQPSACPVEICRVGPFQWKGWLIILNDINELYRTITDSACMKYVYVYKVIYIYIVILWYWFDIFGMVLLFLAGACPPSTVTKFVGMDARFAEHMSHAWKKSPEQSVAFRNWYRGPLRMALAQLFMFPNWGMLVHVYMHLRCIPLRI